MTKLLSRQEYEEMIKKIPAGYCTFCDMDKEIKLALSKYWFWIMALSPYWRYHTMFVPKKHIGDITELTPEEFEDLQSLYSKVKKHILSLELKHSDDKPIDQFVLMLRVREEDIPGGSIIHKPKHLHIHLIPDREGIERFKVDETAVDVDIESIALK